MPVHTGRFVNCHMLIEVLACQACAHVLFVHSGKRINAQALHEKRLKSKQHAKTFELILSRAMKDSKIFLLRFFFRLQSST